MAGAERHAGVQVYQDVGLGCLDRPPGGAYDQMPADTQGVEMLFPGVLPVLLFDILFFERGDGGEMGGGGDIFNDLDCGCRRMRITLGDRTIIMPPMKCFLLLRG